MSQSDIKIRIIQSDKAENETPITLTVSPDMLSDDKIWIANDHGNSMCYVVIDRRTTVSSSGLHMDLVVDPYQHSYTVSTLKWFTQRPYLAMLTMVVSFFLLYGLVLHRFVD